LLFVALAVLLVIGTSALASIQLRGVREALGPRAAELVRELERTPQDARLGKLASKALPDTFEAKLAASLEGIEDPSAKVTATNEALGDLALSLESRARWSPAAVRIVLFAGFLLAALALIKWMLLEACIVMGVGAVGVAIAALMGSRARDLEKEQRKLADAFVEALVPGAPREESVGRRFRDRL
jgi:Flp pilus assembly protein TadB